VFQVYDSNLFASSRGPQADLITRIQPAIRSSLHTTLWDVATRYAFDVERFARHSELTSADAGRDLAADVRYRPTRRLTLAGGAGFTRTLSPSDLSTLTGLVFGRTPATRISARTSVTTQIHRPTTGRLEYAFADDRLAGATRTLSHAAAAGVDQRRGSREIVTVETRLQRFDFSSALERSTTTSAALVAGWTYTLGHGMSVSLEGGPRVTDGSFAPEIAAGFDLQRRSHHASIAYTRTQTPILGLPGVAAAHSFTGAAGWRVWRSLDVTLSPSLVRTALGAMRADSGRLAIGVTRPIAAGLSIALSGAAGMQRGNLQSGVAFDTIRRNEIMIKMIAGRPRRRAATDGR
jgi:hypothetical protein